VSYPALAWLGALLLWRRRRAGRSGTGVSCASWSAGTDGSGCKTDRRSESGPRACRCR
jgi:hypothetical protein